MGQDYPEKDKGSGFLLQGIIFFFIVSVFLPLHAEIIPSWIQYGRFNTFLYNPAYTGNGVLTGSFYMTDEGILGAVELSPESWKQAFGYVYDQPVGRHAFLIAHPRMGSGKNFFVRFGTCGTFYQTNHEVGISEGIMLQWSQFRAGIAWNDILLIHDRIHSSLSSYYTVSYDIKTTHVLLMPQAGWYTNYRSSSLYTMAINGVFSYALLGGGVVTGNAVARAFLNAGIHVKQSALLIGVDGYPLEGPFSAEKRFSSYHLMIRIQL